MKRSKFIIFAGILAAVLLSAGCGTKESKLVCTLTKSGVDVTFNVGFKGNTISTMDFDYDMDLSRYTDEQISIVEGQDFCATVKSAMSDYKNAFTDCKQSVNDKHLIVSSVLDVDKIAKNVLGKMTTPDKAKKELETQGYSCTIK